jgi:Fe-S cluster assembly iron-binding protein IscA
MSNSFCFTDSFEALLSSAEASYLSITDAAQKQIKDQLQNSDSLTGVQIIVEPTSPLKAKYRIELVESTAAWSIKLNLKGIYIFSEQNRFRIWREQLLKLTVKASWSRGIRNSQSAN